ncbi:MAG: FecR family protein [Phycisphaerales bacterium]|nr:FecR family protein [Phycisphaerales bacterium]
MQRGIVHFSLMLPAVLLAIATAHGQENPVAINTAEAVTDPAPPNRIEEIQYKLAQLKGAINVQAEALPEGQTRVLAALVIESKGRCQWRPDKDAAWKKAEVNDSLRPGAHIRTGLNSTLTLRCGLNSTVLVDSNTRAKLPQLIQDGDKLKTIVTVDRGRADIQVDHVGLTNDFSVLTPSGSLAVKGTGMGVQYDGFEGTRIVGARHNRMNAIEMRYFARDGHVWFMSGGAVSTQSVPNPAIGAALETQPEASLQAYEAEDASSYDSVADQALAATDSATVTTRVVLAQERQSVNESVLNELEQLVIANMLAEQEALLLAAMDAAESDIIDEEVVEIIDDTIDNDPPPTQEILDIPGYSSYFAQLQNPSDQAFLAAAMVLDLVGKDTPFGSNSSGIGETINVPGEGNVQRRQLPIALETKFYEAGYDGSLTGGRESAAIPIGYDELPDSGPLKQMYEGLIQYGLDRPDWFIVSSGPGVPTNADLEQMVQIYENYLQANSAAFGGQLVAPRQFFVNSLGEVILIPSTGFTPYAGQLLLNNVPSFSNGLTGGFKIEQ